MASLVATPLSHGWPGNDVSTSMARLSRVKSLNQPSALVSAGSLASAIDTEVRSYHRWFRALGR